MVELLKFTLFQTVSEQKRGITKYIALHLYFTYLQDGKYM